ncbi:MAG: Hsp20/alpha crystallin family protein [Saprospiraceae bacterium]|nr:Hsp20/alpha crystallin family protein [Saprospiraceae bacterium]
MKLTKRNSGKKLAPAFRSLLDDFWGADDFFDRRWIHAPLGKMPAVNIKDNDEDYEIELAAPGLSKDDFEVSIDNNILTISCEKEEKKEETEKNYTREEFNYAAFSRSFSLPENVDEGGVDAAYQDGVLTIKMKKLEMAEPASKTIEIS